MNGYVRLVVLFEKDEWKELLRISQEELRTPAEQMRFFLREGAKRRVTPGGDIAEIEKKFNKGVIS